MNVHNDLRKPLHAPAVAKVQQVLNVYRYFFMLDLEHMRYILIFISVLYIYAQQMSHKMFSCCDYSDSEVGGTPDKHRNLLYKHASTVCKHTWTERAIRRLNSLVRLSGVFVTCIR